MPRRSKVDESKNKDEIEHLLIEQRWGTRALARYLELKYGDVIPSGTLRTWRARRVATLRQQGRLPACWDEPEPNDQTAGAQIQRLLTPEDRLPDVLTRRLALIALQERRIAIDAEHEISMGKLFVSQGREIELLNRMWNDVRTDMQSLGVWPQTEGTPATQVNVLAAAQAGANGATGTENVRVRTLGEMMPGASEEERKGLGRALVLMRRGDDTEGDGDPT